MFNVLKPLARVLKRKRALDNIACWLHHCLTSSLLMLFALLVTARQYVGDPINCYVKGFSYKGVEEFCWVQSTFTMPHLASEAQPGVGVIGFDRDDDWNVISSAPEPKYHQYYQWVWLALVIQAAVTYLPYLVWKFIEGGVISRALNRYEKGKKKQPLLESWVMKCGVQEKVFTVGYFLCESLYFCLDLIQMFLMESFLGGEFFRHGFEVLRRSYLNIEERDDHLAYVFPRVTKCIFRTIGPSGSVQTQEFLCVLPINATNEMIYIFLWFWYFFITAVAATNLAYHYILMRNPHLRRFRLRLILRGEDDDSVNVVADHANTIEFLLLLSLGRNMRASAFGKLLKTLNDSFMKKLGFGKPCYPEIQDRIRIKDQQSPSIRQQSVLNEGTETGWVNMMPISLSPTADYAEVTKPKRNIIPKNPLDHPDEKKRALECSEQEESQIRHNDSEDLKTDDERGRGRCDEFHTFNSQIMGKDIGSLPDCVDSLADASLTVADLGKKNGSVKTGDCGKVLQPEETTSTMEMKIDLTNIGNHDGDAGNGRFPECQEILIDL